MDVLEFQTKWLNASQEERARAQEHFLDLCELLEVEKPTKADAKGTHYRFEAPVTKAKGGKGFADVWYRGHFGWEYKGDQADLKAAYSQLLQYSGDLENPPLLIVCDLRRFEIHTNFTATPHKVYEFDLKGLSDAGNRAILRAAFKDPTALRPAPTVAPDISDQIEAIRQRTVSALGELVDKGLSFGIPGDQSSILVARRRVEDDSYCVAIMAENGENATAFLNALIGEPYVRPQFTALADLGMLFRPSAVEAWRLRFADIDESLMPLPQLTSEVVAQVAQDAGLEHFVRWIEIDVPIPNLQIGRNINLLLLPTLAPYGLRQDGLDVAQYLRWTSAHHRYLSATDAVILVRDDITTMSERELKLVELILNTTDKIFFIQRINLDEYRLRDWERTALKSHLRINERFASELQDTRVWLISTAGLMLATQPSGQPSFHRATTMALEAFLFRVSGASRSTEALAAATEYHRRGTAILSTRLAELGDQSRLTQTARREQMRKAQRQFEADWGDHGIKRRQLLQKFDDSLRAGRHNFEHFDLPMVEAEYLASIEEVESVDAARKLGHDLARNFADTVRQKREELETHLRSRWYEILSQEDYETEKFLLPVPDVGDGMSAPVQPSRYVGDWIKGLPASAEKPGSIGGGLAQEFGDLLVAANLIPPYVTLPAQTIVALLKLARQYQLRERKKLEDAKAELLRHLGDVIVDVRKFYLFTPYLSGSNHAGAVGALQAALKHEATGTVNELAKQMGEVLQAEIEQRRKEDRLQEALRPDEEARLQRSLDKWRSLDRELQSLESEVTAVVAKILEGSRDKREFVVDSNGGADYDSIGDAVAEAPAWSTIFIRHGTYREHLIIERPVELVGDGDRDGVVIEAAGFAVIEWKAGNGRIANLTLRQEGGEALGAIVIEHGEPTIEGCDISSQAPDGIVIRNSSSPTIRSNQIHDAQNSGVYVCDDGRGLIENNDLTNNGRNGVAISSSGDPIVRSNHIRGNHHSGVWAFNRGRGIVEDNEIFENCRDGVAIGNSATLYVRGNNRIHHNDYCGVVGFSGGTASIENNDIFANSRDGVHIRDDLSSLYVARNHIHDNLDNGVVTIHNGTGLIEDNDIYGNKHAGIRVCDRGHPLIRVNRIQDNKQRGVRVTEGGRGMIEGNDITGNSPDVAISDESSPVVRENRLSGDSEIAGTAFSTEFPMPTIKDRWFAIQNKWSGRYVDVDGAGLDNGTWVNQWSGGPETNQQWLLDRQPDGSFAIRARHSGRVLAVSSSSMDNGAQLIQWDWLGIEDQRWWVTPLADGSYRLLNVNSGRALDAGWSEGNWGPLVQWDWHGADNQRWMFVAIE